ncbi:hypothetical protein [Companilactobacillus mishanensis]|uniref:Uncharacterized protein n=1 Tax=Companilactobacillus mishanensis TaxID=2486008 RepID=A0A5P0ZGH9_9LACO|nr:hypothetical protein [Companilactobacillus mishanensis]MQS52156.1 hypothetical protein [Companilactobacillus mishanensis]
MLATKKNINQFRKPDLKSFDYFTLMGPYSMNGYVVIPDEFPTNYDDEIYDDINKHNHFQGLTYAGGATIYQDELTLVFLDNPFRKLTSEENVQLEQVKPYMVRVVGFDDNHAFLNELPADEACIELSNTLKKKYKELYSK